MKLRFRHSWVYDQNHRNSPAIQAELKRKGLSYPTVKEVKDYIKKIEPKWRKIESKVLQEISNVTGLKWTEEEVICYVIGAGRCFSDPLTMKVYESTDNFIDALVHELIHQIHIQTKAFELCNDYLDKAYKDESRGTKNHIFVHAIHKKIYLTLFNQKRLEHDIEDCKVSVHYARAWEIVDREGYENLIKKFRQITN